MNRRYEREDYHVLAGVPEGSRRIQTVTGVWLEGIAQHSLMANKREDFRRNVLRVASSLLQDMDPESKTVTPGWDWLVAVCGLHRRTVARLLGFLRHIGYVGSVAPGRRAQYTPLDSDEFSHLNDKVGRQADRAVYVLCAPLSEEELFQVGEQELERMEHKCTLNGFLARLSAAVDINATPTSPVEKRANPKSIKAWASPTLKDYFRALSERGLTTGGDRTDINWPVERTTNAQDEATTRHHELQAARTLQWHSPVLRSLSTRLVARMCGTWFRSDYTVNDILYAMDHYPDGRQRPHSGFDGARNKAQVFQARMNDWRTPYGTPVYSRSQRVVMEAQDRVARAREVSRRMECSVVTEAPATAFAQGVSMLRAALRLGRKP